MIRDVILSGGAPQTGDAEYEALKREMYEKLPPRRRVFIDRIGYDAWDPFQKPNDPMDIRLDVTKRTTQQLVRKFLQYTEEKDVGNDYRRGALECALGLVNRDEKYLGILDFCLWYAALLKEEGYLDERTV